MPTAWPADVLHFSFECDDNNVPCSFGFWIRADAAVDLGDADFALALYEWSNFTMPSFLDCMSSTTSFDTCRIERRGPVPFTYVAALAPNHGSQSNPTFSSMALGLFINPTLTNQGGGSRLKVPGLPTRFTDSGCRLSEYGQQQLTFAADALVSYPERLSVDWSRSVELGTLRQIRAGARLPVGEFVPAASVRPTLLLPTITRRMRSRGGFSSF